MRLIPNATLLAIDSAHGHDGFLIDAARFHDALLEFKSRRNGTLHAAEDFRPDWETTPRFNDRSIPEYQTSGGPY
jgi:hypothetical protein